jgi:hypothetical protein
LGELEQRIDKLESANSTQGMPEWFRVWSENVYSKDIARLDKIECKIDAIIKLNNLKTM